MDLCHHTISDQLDMCSACSSGELYVHLQYPLRGLTAHGYAIIRLSYMSGMYNLAGTA